MSEEDFNRLMNEAESLDESPAKVSLLEQAVRIADTLGDMDLAYRARNEVIRTAAFCGMAEKALPAFSWCLAQVDKNPSDFDDDEMLWEYKWILPALLQFPSISLQQIIDLEDDFERRLKKAGYSLRPFYDVRFDRLNWPEHAELKQEMFELWKSSRRDHLANCHACEQSGIVSYYFETKQTKAALEKAFMMLKKNVGCHSVPHGMISRMLLPLLRLGRTEEAKELQARGYRMIRNNRDFLSYIGNHMTYLLYTGEIAAGLRMLTRHLPWCLETRELLDKLGFLNSAALLLENAGTRKRKLKLPPEHPGFNESGSYLPSELAVWFRNEAEDLARRFDERNGDSHLINWLKESREEFASFRQISE